MEELGAKQENAFPCQVESTADFSLQNPTAVALQEQNSYCSKELAPAVRSSFPSLSWSFPQEDRGARSHQLLRFVINKTRHWSVVSRLQFMRSLGTAALLNAVNPLNSTVLLLKDPSWLLLAAAAHRNEKCHPVSGSNENSL